MFKIAVLITCYNRKDKTLKSIKCLESAYLVEKEKIDLTLYLVDDGSADGTQDAIKQNKWCFPIKIYNGTGNLFWAGGMRYAWEKAMKDYNYDGYLWLNDDTYMFDTIFSEIIDADQYSQERFHQSGVYIGSTMSDSGFFTYGGYVITNHFFNSIAPIYPKFNEFQDAELGTGNIVYVSKNVVRNIGSFDKYYIHGIADSDYTLTAYRKNIPLLVLRNYQGICNNDHENDGYNKFLSLSLKKRIQFLYSPKGLDLKGNLHFQKKFFPYRIPLYFITAYIKTVFPKLYLKIRGIK